MGDDEAVRWIEETRGDVERDVLVSPATGDEDVLREFEERFEELAEAVASRLGKPAFNDGAAARGYPTWAEAEWVATWERDGGIAYVVLRAEHDRFNQPVAPFRLSAGVSATKPATASAKKSAPRLAPAIPAGEIAKRLKELAAKKKSRRHMLAASKDFFEDRDDDLVEAESARMRAMYDAAKAVLVKELGKFRRESESPRWFPEALVACEWKYEGRTAYLALHQDDAELPFMVSLGIRNE